MSKSKGHWSLGLLESMKDPSTIVKETENIVIIRDKYPKAKLHYLVLSRESIDSIYNLNKTHVDLLKEFGLIFKMIQKDHSDIDLQAGFHAIPSMKRLHMHIISRDMISPCLKTKIHWNSFTTPFFISYDELMKKIKEDGSIDRMPSETHKELMSSPLKCNQCNFEAKSIPKLKEHLLSHCEEDSNN